MFYGSVLQGFRGRPVMVEVDLKRGIPSTVVSGLPRGALLESSDRIRTSIRNSGYTYPYERVLINLSPAGIIKSGTGFDLAIACAILEETGVIRKAGLSVLAVGELQLSGRLLPVEGILNAVLSLRSEVDLILIPPATVKGCFPEDAALVEVDSLEGAVSALNFKTDPTLRCSVPILTGPAGEGGHQFEAGTDLSPAFSYRSNSPDIAGCRLSPTILAGAMLSAFSGLHTFLYGAPGTGKSFCGELIHLLKPDNPELTALEVSRIHSAAAIYGKNGMIREPPCRRPHHSASVEGVIGGGKEGRPGEVTLAHGGMLFMDEAPEFKPSILQALREPLESGIVSISRAQEKWLSPADFQVLMSANLCPCGQYGRETAPCICSVREMIRYWNRIGGALFDRLTLRIPFGFEPKSSQEVSCYSQLSPQQLVWKMQRRVQKLNRHLVKAGYDSSLRRMGEAELNRLIPSDSKGEQILSEAAESRSLSIRRMLDLRRTAVAIALLSGESELGAGAVETALFFLTNGSSPLDQPAAESSDHLSGLLDSFLSADR